MDASVRSSTTRQPVRWSRYLYLEAHLILEALLLNQDANYLLTSGSSLPDHETATIPSTIMHRYALETGS